MIMFSAFSLILISASYVMIKFTDFNVMYERLRSTQMQGIIPDSRDGVHGWPFVVEKILEKPVLGHGPHLLRGEDSPESRRWTEGQIGFYPHNLYL